jgi:hypothetical protein
VSTSAPTPSPKLTYLASPIVFALKEQAQAKISLGLPLDDDALQDLIVQRLATVLPLVDPSAIVDEIQALKAAGHWRRAHGDFSSSPAALRPSF